MYVRIEKLPFLGDIVWCFFPETMGNLTPKPRPAIVTGISKSNHEILVAFGTSKKTDKLYPGEFLIARADGEELFAMSGLSYDTKFDLSRTMILPFTTEFFSKAPKKNNVPFPKLGSVHITYHAAFEKAKHYAAIKKAKKK
ncbi:hypothetical protein [Pectobacterium sp. CHL-2024]|uniref:hypothetical protein n=1 Tax=Pectobacterium sp. CHL-2024 TaxID=3377079 RepID=UPI0037FE90D3